MNIENPGPGESRKETRNSNPKYYLCVFVKLPLFLQRSTWIYQNVKLAASIQSRPEVLELALHQRVVIFMPV